MKNSKPRRLLAAIPLFLVAASSCGKKTPDPPVSCYRKDGGACQFSKLDANGADLRGSLDGQKSESGLVPDGSGGPTDSQLVTVRDALTGDARPPTNDAPPKTPDATFADGLSASAGGAGGSTGTGGMGGSTGAGGPDASAVDSPLIADGPAAARDVLADTRPVDPARDVREAGRDTSLDLVALLDGTDDDAPGALVDAFVNLDAALDAPVDAPAQDAGESSDSDFETAPGMCPAVSQAHQYNVTSLGGLALDGVGTPTIAAKLFDSANFGAGTVTSAGSADLLIAKLDPATLTATWSKSFSGTGEGSNPTDQIPVGSAVSQSGQVGVVGTFEGNLVVNSTTTLVGGGAPIDFIMATDNAGNGLWGKAVDTQSGGLLSIASHPARDEFVVCGYAIGPVTALGLGGTYGDNPDAPLEDILIAKLASATGDVIWARQIGGAGSQVCRSVAMDSTGVVYATGTYNGTLDFGNGALPSMGNTTLAIWVAKLDGADGHALLVKKYGTVGKPAPNSLAVDGNGNAAIAGNLRHSLPFGTTTLTSNGGTDGFLAKLDTNLDPLWAKNWGDAADQVASRVAFTSTGQLFVVGHLKGSANLAGTTLTSAGLLDAYWAAFSTTGESLCAAVYGDADRDQSSSALAIHGDRVVVGGFSSGTITFAPGLTLTSTTPKGFLFVLP
jgi:hypothetical protein